ncbi:MAG: hypothetical protein GYA24_07480 [Candidatus Lokiarchaeota archaeon]|nr:hypothetical protein [Candidatus Lokiarchaeota archaeon]
MKRGHRNVPIRFDDIQVGHREEFTEKITLDRHRAFSELFEDFSPVHVDEGYCKQTSFGKIIGYGFMLTGFLSKLYGEYLPGGNSICLKQESRFIKPFYIGDEISIAGEVMSKTASTRVVEIKTEMRRNGDELIFKGVGTVQILPPFTNR